MSRENVEVVRLCWAGFNADRLPPPAACDARIEIGNVKEFPVQGPYHGREGVRRWATDMFEVFDEARIKLDEAMDVGDGECVVTVQRLLALAKHTRIPIDAPWAQPGINFSM